MTIKLFFLPLLSLVASAALCETTTITLPANMPLPVKIEDHVSMRVGTPIRARLMYPVFVDNELILPSGSLVTGSIVALRPDHARRVRARFNADFTPFYIPVVRFTAITLPSGAELAIATSTATDGAPLFRVVPALRRKGNFFSRQIAGVEQVAKDDIAVFTAPGLGDRMLHLFYSQLPYHPQRIEKDTAWTVETSAAATFETAAPTEATARAILTVPAPAAGEAASPEPATWLLEAYLAEPLSSATTKAGEQVRAIVAEPIFNADHTLAVPQGAVLLGTVSRAQPARAFGRAGVLRFNFQQMEMPNGQISSVQTALKGADSNDDTLLTAEGEAKPKPQDKVIVPILLSALAGRALHGSGRHQRARDLTASNGGGFLGRILGTAIGSPGLAAGIGYYQVAVSTYMRWIAHGKQVTFAKDTRVEIQTTSRRTAPLRPTMVVR